MKYWDEILFPQMLQTIRGERYLCMTNKQIADELILLAKRAVNNFLFPKISLKYSFENQPTDEIYPQRYYFENDNVGDAEINVILAWMKVFWADFLISNADSFQNIFYDNNLQTYSPGTLLKNYLAAKEEWTLEARGLEDRYYRVSDDGAPAIADGVDEQ